MAEVLTGPITYGAALALSLTRISRPQTTRRPDQEAVEAEAVAALLVTDNMAGPVVYTEAEAGAEATATILPIRATAAAASKA